jgi:hypothetical protein
LAYWAYQLNSGCDEGGARQIDSVTLDLKPQDKVSAEESEKAQRIAAYEMLKQE